MQKKVTITIHYAFNVVFFKHNIDYASLCQKNLFEKTFRLTTKNIEIKFYCKN